MSHAIQTAHDHAKTVIQRNRYTDSVLFGVFHRLAIKEAVVKNIFVRQRRTFG